MLQCKPCVIQPTSPEREKKGLSTLDRARAAASKLCKPSSARARAEGNIETAVEERRTSTPLSQNLSERPFGSTLERAQAKAAELKAMRCIGKALQDLDTLDSLCSSSVPYDKSISTSLRTTYNSFSVYTSKLSSGNFGDILDPVPDLADDESDLEESSSLEKGGEPEQFNRVQPRFLSPSKTAISRKGPNKLRSRQLHDKLHSSQQTLRAMCACPLYRRNGLNCEPSDIDTLYCCDSCHRAMGKVRRSHRRIDKDKYFKGQYWGGDCTGFKTPSIVTGYTYALVLIEFHTRLKESYFGVNKDADRIISLLKK